MANDNVKNFTCPYRNDRSYRIPDISSDLTPGAEPIALFVKDVDVKSNCTNNSIPKPNHMILQWNLSKRPPPYSGHLPTAATFLQRPVSNGLDQFPILHTAVTSLQRPTAVFWSHTSSI